MRTSENLSNIAAALSKAQGEMPAAPKDADNSHLRNKYATLGSIITTAAPVLARHGLSFVQMPSEAESGFMALTTRILHESGEWVEDTMRVAVPPSKLSEVQAAGSVISYCRRYALASALGIVTDDDDGNMGQRPAPQPAQRAQAASSARSATTTQADVSKADTGLVVAINRKLEEEYGFKSSERDDKLSFIGFLAGVTLTSSKDLTPAQADAAMTRLKAGKDQSGRDELVQSWVDARAMAVAQ